MISLNRARELQSLVVAMMADGDDPMDIIAAVKEAIITAMRSEAKLE